MLLVYLDKLVLQLLHSFTIPLKWHLVELLVILCLFKTLSIVEMLTELKYVKTSLSFMIAL